VEVRNKLGDEGLGSDYITGKEGRLKSSPQRERVCFVMSVDTERKNRAERQISWNRAWLETVEPVEKGGRKPWKSKFAENKGTIKVGRDGSGGKTKGRRHVYSRAEKKKFLDEHVVGYGV